jgi:NAD(P)-dependent dehydrogenase (short-subunit alcohol dehydrogenase family)
MQTQCYGANVYASTKYAQRGIAEVLRWELLPYNIHAHVVCPGFVDTPMTKLGKSSPKPNQRKTKTCWPHHIIYKFKPNLH